MPARATRMIGARRIGGGEPRYELAVPGDVRRGRPVEQDGGAVERWNGGTVERWSGGAVERWSEPPRPWCLKAPHALAVAIPFWVAPFTPVARPVFCCNCDGASIWTRCASDV